MKYKDKKEYRENVYRLSSYTCLAGDIIGDYKFDSKINIGDRLVFEDMAIYSMVPARIIHLMEYHFQL